MKNARAPIQLVGTVFLVGLILAVTIQFAGSAYIADISGDDEAAHYVSGIMAGDYVAAGQRVSPMAFAQSYYERFPKVAIGHWPPMLYSVSGAWSVMFGAGRVATMALWAIFAAAAATALFGVAFREFGLWAAAGVAVAFLLTAKVQQFGSIVMAEIPLTLGMLVSFLAFRALYETGETRQGILFGIASLMALLTKANGFALAMLPVLAIVFGRRYQLLKRPGLWISALICCAALPWYYLTRQAAVDGWQGSSNAQWLLLNVGVANVKFLFRSAGAMAFLLAVVGAWTVFRSKREEGSLWPCAAAMIAAIFVFHTFFAPTREARHFIYAIPFVLLFAAAGLRALTARLDRRAAAGVIGFAAAVFVWEAGLPSPKEIYGAQGAARQVLDLTRQPGNILISSASRGEGALIAETVMAESRDRRVRPGYRLLRATKVLARSGWDGRDSRLVYDTPDQVLVALRKLGVRWVALDTRATGIYPHLLRHHRLMEQTIERYSSTFLKLPLQSGSFAIYELRGADGT